MDENRGPAYPLCGLSKALTIASAVKELGGSKTEVPKSVLSAHLKVRESSPSLTQAVTSARAYGMVSGRSAYQLTAAAVRYFYPTGPNDKKSAMLAFLGSPNVFKLLIRKFDGSPLPKNETLQNVLHQEANVPDSWSPRVAGFFSNGARDAGAVDQGGFLRYEAGLRSDFRGEPPQTEPAAEQHEQIAVPVRAVPATRDGANVWVYGGGLVRVETPVELSLSLWQALDAYVKILRPGKEGE